MYNFLGLRVWKGNKKKKNNIANPCVGKKKKKKGEANGKENTGYYTYSEIIQH